MVAVLPVFLSRLGATNAVIGALPVIWLLGSGRPFPANYALGFLVAGVCMAIGSFFFLPVREDAGAMAESSPALATVLRYVREILGNRTGLRVYLAVLLLSVGRFLLITYYPVFAQSRFSHPAPDS